jgi:hypothetical protein
VGEDNIPNAQGWSMSRNKLIASEFNLTKEQTSLPYSGTEQAQRKNGNSTSKSSIRVCQEFLPPPLLAFGIPAAMFALGLYIQGRVFIRAGIWSFPSGPTGLVLAFPPLGCWGCSVCFSATGDPP